MIGNDRSVAELNSATAVSAFMASYLVSELGRDTPDSVARALFAMVRVQPWVLGKRPRTELLHEWRVLIQDIHTTCPDDDAEMAELADVDAAAFEPANDNGQDALGYQAPRERAS